MKKKISILLALVFVLVSTVIISQINQGGGTEGAEVAAEATGNSLKLTKEVSAFEFLMKGGVFLIPILLLLFYTVMLLIEKLRYIKRMGKYDAYLLDGIKSNLQAGDVNAALNNLERDRSAYGSVLREGVMTIGRPIGEIESNMEKVVNIEVGNMERNLGHLGLIAGIAPTLGFIGTISGVIKIFYTISITENVSIGNISGGLYEKMISSGAGLIVGIIAFAAYHILLGMIDKYILNIQKVNLEFVNVIQRPNGNKTK